MTRLRKKKIYKSKEARKMLARIYHFMKDEYIFMKDHNVDNCDLSPLYNTRMRVARAVGASGGMINDILREEKLKKDKDKVKLKEDNRAIQVVHKNEDSNEFNEEGDECWHNDEFHSIIVIEESD